MPRHIYLGTNAPSFTPTGIGHHYIDTVAKKPYTSVGTDSAADWSEGGGGGAPLSPDDPLPVGSTPSPGISEEASAGDHVHEGLHSLAVTGEAQILGDAELAAGANIILTQVGNSIEISSSAGRSWQTVMYSPTITVDVTSTGGFAVVLSGNPTIAAPTGVVDAYKSIMFKFTQDATGGRTVFWSSAWNFGADLYGVNVSTTANTTTYVGAIYNATTLKWDIIAWSRGY